MRLIHKRQRFMTTITTVSLLGLILFIVTPIIAADNKIFDFSGFDIVGNTIKGIFIDLADFLNSLKMMFVEVIMKVSLAAFSPNYSTIIAIDQGYDAYLYSVTPGIFSGIKAGDTTFVSQIHGIAIAAGFVFIFFLGGGNLILCVFGRSKHIKNSVAYIVITIFLSTAIIYLSDDIISSVIVTINDIWQEFVISDVTGGDNILSAPSLSEKDATLFDIMTITKEAGLCDIGIKGLGNFQVSSPFSLAFVCLSIFFTWKLIKGYLSIFMELVERYMVLMILGLFLPAATPTIISSGTSNIFKAYLRMVFSETFLFIVNGIFMKVFLFYLVKGGWTAGIMNYLAALAFLKVCSKFDGWLKALGLNVAQTGGGLLNAIGGSLSRGVMMLTSLANSASRIGNAAGGAMMTKGLAMGDYDMFHRGEMLKNGLFSAVAGNEGTTQASFNASVAQNAQRELQVGKGFGEAMRTTSCGEGGEFNDWMTNSGLSDATKSSILGAGIDTTSCSSINEWKGSGVAAFYDKEGSLMGSVNNGRFIKADQAELTGEGLHNDVISKSDSVGRKAAQAMEKPYLPNDVIKKHTGLTSISGTHGSVLSGTDPLKRSHADGTKPGRQVVTGTQNVLQQNGNIKSVPRSFEIYKGSLSPEIIADVNRGGRYEHITHDGEDYYMREIKSERISDDEPTIVSEEEMSTLDMSASEETISFFQDGQDTSMDIVENDMIEEYYSDNEEHEEAENPNLL